MEEHVSHPGVVVGIGEQDLEIEILSKEFIVGQPVSIIMNTKQGNKAALFAYFIPAFLLVAIIVILSNLSVKEWLSALIGIGAIAVYYLILSLFKNRLRNEFRYEIK